MLSRDIYVHFDELENLPNPNRENYLFESEYLRRELAPNCRVLQVGSMDGMRIIRLHELRPDLTFVGMEIESELVDVARANVTAHSLDVTFMVGDITTPAETTPKVDTVICLNNTLGFIPDWPKAITEMRNLGDRVHISVFGEKFTDSLALDYYAGIGIRLDRIEGNTFISDSFGEFRRFGADEVAAWGGEVTPTPLGYLVSLTQQSRSPQ